MVGVVCGVHTWGQASSARNSGRERYSCVGSTHIKAPTAGVVPQEARLVCVLGTGI